MHESASKGHKGIEVYVGSAGHGVQWNMVELGMIVYSYIARCTGHCVIFSHHVPLNTVCH